MTEAAKDGLTVENLCKFAWGSAQYELGRKGDAFCLGEGGIVVRHRAGERDGVGGVEDVGPTLSP